MLAKFDQLGLRGGATLWDLVSGHDAGKVAVICPRSGPISYGRLRREAEGLAAAWVADGLKPGDVVILQLPNWYEMVLSHLALTRCGGVTLCLLPSYRERELRFIAELSGAVGIVCSPSLRSSPDADLYERLVDELEDLRWMQAVDEPGVLFDLAAAGDPAVLPELPDP